MVNEKRLIDANALIDEIDGIYQRHYANSCYKFIHDFFRAMFRRIKNVPTVDAVEVVHGWWIENPDNPNQVYCSHCNMILEGIATGFYYCPNCGAKMDGENK